jgi:receptor-type tyrosine-protein phosphatase gamma
MDQVVIEGPARKRDLSYEYFSTCQLLVDIERGIPINEYLQQIHLRNRDLEYQLLRKITETKQHGALLYANSPTHQAQNRYCDILPYRDTMALLSSGSYINASLVDGSVPNSEEFFIATQGPLSSTCSNFWLMVWELNTALIVMLTKFSEAGVAKCSDYFPREGSMVKGSIEIILVGESQPFPSLTHRKFRLRRADTDEEKTVDHFQSVAWPDHSCPVLECEFEALNYLVYRIKKVFRRRLGRVLVHCSAGVGRTGTLISIFQIATSLERQLLNQAQDPTVIPRISIFGTVRRLREQRWGMVQTKEQYEFLYKYTEWWITAFLLQHQTP